jgi:RES domain-containing protein
MPHAWRIVRTVRVADAFSGEGARLGGGRWNSREVPVVYTSEHQSLAALELLVHINPQIQIELVVFRIEWENFATEKVFLNQLPSNWRDQPPAGATVALGDQWARRRKSVLLAVPSVLIPEESNYLINPLHPDFKRLEIGPPKPFSLDQRLLA